MGRDTLLLNLYYIQVLVSKHRAGRGGEGEGAEHGHSLVREAARDAA